MKPKAKANRNLQSKCQNFPFTKEIFFSALAFANLLLYLTVLFQTFINNMIKMHTPNLTSSTIRSLASLKASQTCKTTSNLQLISPTTKNPQVDLAPKQIITVCHESLEKHKQILQWRQNTDFPIVKIKSYAFLEKKHDFASSFLEILVELESQMRKFNELKKLPIFQAIYVLKESMIGFERLCHRFGFFNLSPEMIMFNENQNCKVWINKEWYSNEIEPSSIKSQKEFILQLCDIVEEKAVKSKISLEFFDKIRNCKFFFEAIGCIETFAKLNKIKIPGKLQNLDEIKSPLLKTSTTMDTKMIETKRNNLVISAKIPRFIKKVEVKKLASQEIYTPLPRKISMATEFCANDRSFTNVSRNHSTNSFLKNDHSENRIQETDAAFDEDDFLKNLNIRLIQPNGQKGMNTTVYSPMLSQKIVANTPETQFSPLGVVSQFDINEDKKSGFSFNSPIKRQESSSFETAERMFLTVCRSNTGNGLFSPVKKTKPQFSPRCIRTLQYLDAEDIESLEDFESQPKENKFMPISINQIKEKRKLSGDFGKGSGRLDQEQSKNDDEKELYTPQYKTTNILNLPRQSHNGLAKSPSHLVICRNLRKKQQSELQEEEKEQEEREFLRQNIMSINGWKGLSILQEKKQIQRSFVDENQEIPIKGQAKTSELPKLGGMGRDVKTSMIEDFEFELEYGNQLEKARSVRNDFIGLLE